jgi:hypothetical protein
MQFDSLRTGKSLSEGDADVRLFSVQSLKFAGCLGDGQTPLQELTTHLGLLRETFPCVLELLIQEYLLAL